MKNIIEINNMLDESLEVKLLNLYTPNSGYAVSMAAYNIEKNKRKQVYFLVKRIIKLFQWAKNYGQL